MNVLTIAEALGKFEHEVLALPPHAYARQVAYFKIRQKEEADARRKAEAKNRRK